jgi:class 3 adenylate cyclase
VGFFARLFGPPEEFTLEHRLLNAATLFAVIACLPAPVVYLLVDSGAVIMSAAALGMGVVSAGLYWLSRVKRVYRLPAIVVTFFTMAGAILFFVQTSGSRGSALSVFPVTLLASAVLFRGTERLIMLGIALVMPAGLLALELLHPEWVRDAVVSRETRLVFVALTYGGSLFAIGGLALVVVRAYNDATDRLKQEQARSQRLLDNVLPHSVSERLKAQPGTIADAFEDVTVLFADLAGFTQRSARMPPAEVVTLLNDVFSRFDELCTRHGLEKVKTIGDAYMAVAGIPEPRADHAEAAARLALDMLAAMPDGLHLRIGLHTGPAVAGVIGTRKFIYDLWGDTVNTASRMESHSEPGRIQVSRATWERLQSSFRLVRRGVIPVKGKGEMETFFLEG